jgi:tripartite-type tricarboxylate transporter receptor subunit TctC
LAVLAALATSIAAAQPYPNKAIKVIVPYPAGGFYDLIARNVGPRLGDALGQPVVIENRVGANGIVGTEYTAKSPADGYTIIIGGIGPHGINPGLYPKLPYDPIKDFVPIIHVASSPNILVVHPSAPLDTVSELIAIARAKPGQLSYASNGNGSSQHLSAEMFAAAMSLKLNHVPFKGSAPAVTAMLGGQTDMTFGIAGDVVPHVKAGKLRALAVTSTRRVPALPDTPTMHEAGVSGYESTAWFGYLAPAGTPRKIVTRLNADIAKVLEPAEIRERITQGVAEIVGGTPEQFGSFIRAEIAKWTRVVKDANVRVD